MKLRRASLRAFELALHRPLGTAHGPIRARRGWLVECEDESGQVGYGEATPLPEFGTEDFARCREVLEGCLTRLVRAGEFEDLSAALRAFARPDDMGMGPRTDAAPCARAATESALFDLSAKRNARSLASEIRAWAGLDGAAASSVATQGLVGGDDADAVSDSVELAKAAGFDAFKLKLAVHPGDRGLARDLERVAALRAAAGPAARLRLDANEAWTLAEAERALEALVRFDIDYVEQPLAREDLSGLSRLSRESPVAVAADEALLGAGLAACLEAGAARILILKPAALAGVVASCRVFERARAEGLRVVWSTLIDGAVGRALPLALAAGLAPGSGTSGEGEVHGLGTADLLEKDLCGAGRGDGEAVLERGRLYLPHAPGIGFVPVIPKRAAREPQAGGGTETPCFEIRARVEEASH